MDVIITNPPFGGMEEDGIEKNFGAFSTRETADLFMVLIMRRLKENGRAAVVLPDGFLFGEGTKTRIKEKLLDECNLHTIIRLPNGVFAPYTSIKTNLLFFTKGEPTKEIWYYEHSYPEGYKSYSKTKPMRIAEFATEKAWWTNRKETEQAWCVDIDTIKASNYNLDIKNPHNADEGPGDPDELLAEYQGLQSATAAAQDPARRGTGVQGMTNDQFLQQFGHFIDAPNGIRKLHELILQLAVQGKLVSQVSDDETASELLNKTISEKVRLTKEKVIRKTKEPIFPDETPTHKLPDSWVWTNLYEIGEIGPRNSASNDSESSFVPMPLISVNYGTPILHEVRLWKEIKSGFTHFKEDDVVLAKITPCFQNGKSAVMRGLTNGFGAGTTELHVYRAINNCTVPDYVLIHLKSPGFILGGIPKMTGTAGQKRITRDYFSGNYFPLPPLAEQHRIVAKVDELMTLSNQLEAERNAREVIHQRLIRAVHHPLTEGADTTATPGIEQLTAWHRIRDNFTDLYTTLESVHALRQTILQLAVQGKLVEQNPKDEPALAIVERIRNDKSIIAQLNKKKRTSTNVDNKALEDMPAAWEVATIEEIAILKSGTSQPKESEQDEGETLYLKVGDMNLPGNELVISTSSRYINRTTKIEGQLIPANSIIFPKRGGAIATNKKRIVRKELLVDLNTMAMTPSRELYFEYILLVLRKRSLEVE